MSTDFQRMMKLPNVGQSITPNVWRLAEVPHSRNFGFEQELYCGILANRCYAYVPTCLAECSIGNGIEIFN